MDSLIVAAGRALARGDPLGALKLVALRDDAPALALRGTAMAQLGEFTRARELLKRAARAFGRKEPLARARCVVAEAEVALASRELAWNPEGLNAARALLEGRGDDTNAAHARYLEARRLLLLGRLEAAERAVGAIDPQTLSAALRTVHELVVWGIAIRRVQAGKAREALRRASQAAASSGIPALSGEVEAARQLLDAPVARSLSNGKQSLLQLDEAQALFESTALVVDATRFAVRQGDAALSLSGRPVLFALACALAEAWPQEASRDALVQRAFRHRRANESLRARLRVEIGRLRRVLRPMAEVSATAGGFVLRPEGAIEVVVLRPPVDEPHAQVLALLSDGEQWSSSALALALGQSQRTVQRALEELAALGKAQPYGRGRVRRWLSPLPGITSALLLPVGMGDG